MLVGGVRGGKRKEKGVWFGLTCASEDEGDEVPGPERDHEDEVCNAADGEEDEESPSC